MVACTVRYFQDLRSAEGTEVNVKQSHKTLLLWVVLILMFVAFYQFFAQRGREPNRLDFSPRSVCIARHPAAGWVVIFS